jgi:copper/silver efflux system protein
VSFLPVFTLQAAEGKLFGPLAYTKTFALVAALIITLFMMPAFAHWLFSFKAPRKSYRTVLNSLLILLGNCCILVVGLGRGCGYILGLNNLLAYWAEQQKLPSPKLNNFLRKHHNTITIAIVAAAVSWFACL